ncbi:MAG: hypothetical protein Q9227_002244 [Pyrenula ochraceoflavens]
MADGIFQTTNHPLSSSFPAAVVSNATTYFHVPSTKELFNFPLRVAKGAQRFAGRWLPTEIGDLIRLNPSVGAEAAAERVLEASKAVNNAAGGTAAQMATNVLGRRPETVLEAWEQAFYEIFGWNNIKSFGGLLSYLTSRWAFASFTLALILNRVTVYAGSRQRIHLTWDKRLTLRIVPILLLVSQIHNILLAIRCQTCTNYSLYRHGSPDVHKSPDWPTEGGFLYTLSSSLLFWETDLQACRTVQMARTTPDKPPPYGSFSLLWPIFLTICLGHFVESLSCSLQQRTVMTEAGMSVFEHSLAFAEAETMVSHALGLRLIGSKKPSSLKSEAFQNSTITASEAMATMSSIFVLEKFNVPTEVLLISLISCFNYLTASIIALFDKQRQLRLFNTALWGACFMATFAWSLFHQSSNSQGDLSTSILRIPTVCIIGFMPHILILLGISICSIIYSLALTVTAFSLDTNPNIPRPTTFLERFAIAHDNLHAAIHLRGVRIRWSEDFYTTLLRVGFAALMAASEAVFLSEGRSVEVRRFTWLEEDRLDEFEASRHGSGSPRPTGTHFHITEEVGMPLPSEEGTWQSGYQVEKKFEADKDDGKSTILNISDGRTIHPQPGPGGVGALQRSSRFYLLLIFFRGIFFLLSGWSAYFTGVTLDRLGITGRPAFLRKIIGSSLKRARDEKERASQSLPGSERTMEFWMLNEQGELTTPKNDDVDIEQVMRERMLTETNNQPWTETEEARLDSHLYRWWKTGGWWGLKDDSVDFVPQDDENDDTTSMISMSTNADASDGEAWESESDGRQTPTQATPYPSDQHMPLTDLPLDASSLARLLDPPDREAKSEARILAAHLQASASSNANSSSRIVTRSAFRRQMELERARVLLAGRSPSGSKKLVSTPILPSTSASPPTADRPLTPGDEAEILEQLILTRRKRVPADTGNEEEEAKGPLCVVCQSTPRNELKAARRG